MITRRAGFAEVLGGGSFGVAAVVTDSLVADQPGKGNDPACGMTNTLDKTNLKKNLVI